MAAGKHHFGSRLIDGEVLRTLRAQKDWGQKELASHAGVSRELIVRLERGGVWLGHRPRVSIATALGVAPERLIVGWKSAPNDNESPPDSNSLLGPYLTRLPIAASPLYGRDETLDRLDAAWADQDCGSMVVVAEGGAGKTALVAEWLGSLRQKSASARIYDFSFNSADFSSIPSAQAMIDHAFSSFGMGDPEGRSAESKCDALCSVFLNKPTAFVVDGLEVAQHPPGHPLEGRIIEPVFRSLLRRMAQSADSAGSLLLLTTRLPVTDLRQWEPKKVRNIHLEGLGLEAARSILQSYDVRGRERDVLRPVLKHTKGHALTLHLLAGYIQDRFAGDGRAWREHGDLTDVPRVGMDAVWVMNLYEAWFQDHPAKLQLLRLISLFDGVTPLRDLDALVALPPIRGLTDQLHGLPSPERVHLIQQLTRSRLLLPSSSGDDQVDMHVIVREYFRNALRVDNRPVWLKGNQRLAGYFKQQCPPVPDSPDDVRVAYSVIKHACRAEDYHSAYHHYRDSIHSSQADGAVRKFGLFAEDLSTLYAFFDFEKGTPVSRLPLDEQVAVATQTATRLRWIGRLGECIRIMEWVLTISPQRKSLSADRLVASRYIPECELLRGELRQAEQHAQIAIQIADDEGDWIARVAARTIHAAALHHLGRLSDSRHRFEEAESLQKKLFPKQPILNSVRAFRYHELLLDQGEFQLVAQRCRELLKPRQRDPLHALDIGPVDEGIARLGMALSQWKGRDGTVETILENVEVANSRFQASGRREFMYAGQIAAGELQLAQGQNADAVAALEAVQYECEQDEMRRLSVDADLARGRGLALLRRTPEATALLQVVRKRVTDWPYERRRAELERLMTEVTMNRVSRPEQLLKPRRSKAGHK